MRVGLKVWRVRVPGSPGEPIRRGQKGASGSHSHKPRARPSYPVKFLPSVRVVLESPSTPIGRGQNGIAHHHKPRARPGNIEKSIISKMFLGGPGEPIGRGHNDASLSYSHKL